MTRVKLNCSGVNFEFDDHILENKNHHTLTKMCEEAVSTGKPLEFFVNRPSDCFAAILGYYQTGKLHMPAAVCPDAFRAELEYWSVASSDLSHCCLYRYFAFFGGIKTQEEFRMDSLERMKRDKHHVQEVTNNCSHLKAGRRRLWRIVDDNEDTIYAKVYLLLVFLMVMLCTFTLALSTEPVFQRGLTRCEMLEHLEYTNHEAFDSTRIKFGNPNCSDSVDHTGEVLSQTDLGWEEIDSDTNDTMNTTNTTMTKVILPDIKITTEIFDILEYVVGAFFTIDLLIRLFTCPSLVEFFKSILNMFDILAVLGFYCHLFVVHLHKAYKYDAGWAEMVNYMQIFRIMRLLRIIRNVRASRVLVFSIRSNLQDISLLFLLLMIGVSTSACLVYFMEDREAIPTIPQAWYWSIITLTTVGYGDITPKSAGGRLIAAGLAVCGILMLAITVPMFVNNFLTLYQYSCIDASIEDKIESDETWNGIPYMRTVVDTSDKKENHVSIRTKQHSKSDITDAANVVA